MATAGETPEPEPSRREFLSLTSLTSVGVLAAGAGFVGWSFVDYLNPSADVLALASTEFDLSGLEPGQSVTILWRGKPVFVRHRTEDEIEAARADDGADLRDAQMDSDRVVRPEFLVVLGVCTHLGCVPLGTKSGDPRGDYGGWFCPCHGSHYDTAGRIRRGPAPANLEVPEYTFLD
ncbi:MAG: ubiquinol-cytochrome c reductase iron-sulfur subunit, partial [Pseudomonadota bacterium]